MWPYTNSSGSLPLLTVGNDPVIQPMSIVDWKWDFSTSPPTKLVLVRWEGAAPEDTTWEDWEQLWTSYDLEDKVFLPDGGDVNNLELNRPKIYSTRSKYLSDFV